MAVRICGMIVTQVASSKEYVSRPFVGCGLVVGKVLVLWLACAHVGNAKEVASSAIGFVLVIGVATFSRHALQEYLR